MTYVFDHSNILGGKQYGKLVCVWDRCKFQSTSDQQKVESVSDLLDKMSSNQCAPLQYVGGFDRNVGPWNQAKSVSSESLHSLEMR